MSDTILGAVMQYMDERGLKYEWVDGQTVLQTGFGSPWGPLMCWVHVLPEDGMVAFHVVLPVQAPVSQRPGMAELLTRANFGLRIGNFEMDWADGEIRYKTSVCFRDQPFPPGLMGPLIGYALSTVELYTPALMGVLSGNMTPAAAVNAVKAQLEPTEEPTEDQDEQGRRAMDCLRRRLSGKTRRQAEGERGVA